jgi:nucleoside-diphosphate-sugar epimerase
MLSVDCKNLVNTGTSWQHYRNEDYNPVCLYAATKQAFEDIIRYYSDALNIRAVTLKLFDTFGAGDTRPKLMNLIKKIANDGSELQMSPGEQMIDLVYIDDVVDAFIASSRIIQSMEGGSQTEFCVSSGHQLNVKQIVAVYEKVIGKKINAVFGGRPYRQREVMTLWTKCKLVPGWSPKITLEEGIEKFHELR